MFEKYIKRYCEFQRRRNTRKNFTDEGLLLPSNPKTKKFLINVIQSLNDYSQIIIIDSASTEKDLQGSFSSGTIFLILDGDKLDKDFKQEVEKVCLKNNSSRLVQCDINTSNGYRSILQKPIGFPDDPYWQKLQEDMIDKFNKFYSSKDVNYCVCSGLELFRFGCRCKAKV